MGADHLETGFAQRLATEAEGIDGRVVLGDINLCTGPKMGQGLGRVYTGETCGFKLKTQLLDSQKIDGACVEERNESVEHIGSINGLSGRLGQGFEQSRHRGFEQSSYRTTERYRFARKNSFIKAAHSSSRTPEVTCVLGCKACGA